MNHEIVFRIVVAGVLLTFFLSGALIGLLLRNRKSRGKVVKRAEGKLKLGAVGFLFLVWVSASVAFVVNPAWMSWSALPLPAWLRWTGAGVFLAILGLPLSAFLSLEKNYSGTVVIKESHTLVTSGPYRWIRHPIYTSYFGLALLALSILLASRVGEEEALLLERFGDEYRAYMRRTGRFLPRLLRH